MGRATRTGTYLVQAASDAVFTQRNRRTTMTDKRRDMVLALRLAVQPRRSRRPRPTRLRASNGWPNSGPHFPAASSMVVRSSFWPSSRRCAPAVGLRRVGGDRDVPGARADDPWSPVAGTIGNHQRSGHLAAGIFATGHGHRALGSDVVRAHQSADHRDPRKSPSSSFKPIRKLSVFRQGF